MSRKDQTTSRDAGTDHDDASDDLQDSPAAAGPSDVELIKATFEGDRSAYARLAERYWPWVFAKAAASLPNRDQADQVARTVLVRAYKKLDHLDDALRFPAFLNGHLDEVLDALFEKTGDGGKRRRSAIRRDRVKRAAEGVGKDDRGDFLYEYLRDLPHRFKTLLALKTQHKLSYTEIASFVDMTPGAVRGRLHQIKYKLARYLRAPEPPTRRHQHDDEDDEDDDGPLEQAQTDADEPADDSPATGDEDESIRLDDILTDEDDEDDH